jgi:hypothetical protein
MLINYLICGTQKGGTSALYNYFKKHPQIYIYEKKEAHFLMIQRIIKRDVISIIVCLKIATPIKQ